MYYWYILDMKRITEYTDYRALIQDYCEDRNLAYRKLAETCGVHTSYFSRVMVGKAGFSREQIFQLGQHMGLTDWKLDYLLLLVEHDSSGTVAHKAYVAGKLQRLREKHDKLAAQLEGVRNQKELSEADRALYYESSATALVHMYLTTKKYRDNLPLIAKVARLSPEQVERHVQILERLNVISRDRKGIKVLQYSVHLEEGDPLLRMHHLNWRLEAVQQLRYGEEGRKGHHVSAVFSTDQESVDRIKALFKKFVVEAQKEASKIRNDEEVYCLNFDLF